MTFLGEWAFNGWTEISRDSLKHLHLCCGDKRKSYGFETM